MRKRYLIPLSSGEINVLVEEQDNPILYKFAAVLNDWDQDCQFETGNTVEEAVENLATLIDATLPDNWSIYAAGPRIV
jgi:hypothetical protein